ncbi:hypothetical protein [Comamonas sp. 4034]|uniref:hypothetical protein n=1 Tax=Comamonas sp. 4034 TaxID=3156455 RepID=UPI003D23DD2F
MQIEPTVSQAFATLETAFHTDFLSRLPSRHNLMYRQFLERQFMLRIGTSLAALPESVDRLWIAHLLRRYLRRDLGLDTCPDLPTELPRFLWPRGYELPRVDVVALSEQIEALWEPAPDPPCIAERNLFKLETLLHLRPAETALIELAYAASPDGWPQSDSDTFEPDQNALHAVLMCLNWRDLAERDHVFSVLLGVSPQDAAALLANPATLLALHLIDNTDWHRGNGAFAYAVATEKLFAVLETQYLTHAAMLADLQSLPFDRCLDPDDMPEGMLYEYMPPLVADAYIAARQSRHLTVEQLAALVHWQTGMTVTAESVQALASQLDFETVCRALAQAVLDCRRADAVVKPLTLLKALYAAA